MKGLTNKEVEENRNKYGSNRLEKVKSNSFFKLLLESLGDNHLIFMKQLE